MAVFEAIESYVLFGVFLNLSNTSFATLFLTQPEHGFTAALHSLGFSGHGPSPTYPSYPSSSASFVLLYM
jgi:hypothetical protein